MLRRMVYCATDEGLIGLLYRLGAHHSPELSSLPPFDTPYSPFNLPLIPEPISPSEDFTQVILSQKNQVQISWCLHEYYI